MNSIDWRSLRKSIKENIIRVIDQESMRENIRKNITRHGCLRGNEQKMTTSKLFQQEIWWKKNM
jgi:hypothetical protein